MPRRKSDDRRPARLPRGGADREYQIAKEQFRQGREYELALILPYLCGPEGDGIGSGKDAAALLERKGYRR